MPLGPAEAGTMGLLVCKWLLPESCVTKAMSSVISENLTDFFGRFGSGWYSTAVCVLVLANPTGHNTKGCPGGPGHGTCLWDPSGPP